MNEFRESSPWQLMVYIPKEKRTAQLLERLKRVAQQQRRSINFIVVEALEQYLQGVEEPRQPTNGKRQKG
jgi:hypothetical protein